MHWLGLTLSLAQTHASALGGANDFIVAHAGTVVLIAVAVALALLLLFRRWVWREMTALQTAQIFMILLVPLLLAGVLLPQGGNYDGFERLAKWAWMANLAKGLRLMDVYQAAPFYVLLTMVVVCALFCSIRGLAAIARKRVPPGPTLEEVSASPGAVTIKVAMPFGPESAVEVYKALKRAGLRAPQFPDNSPPRSIVFETGSGTLWPAVLFHLGMLLLVIGFLVTWFFGFGGHVCVYTGQPGEAPLVSKDTRWHALRSAACAKWGRLFGHKKKEKEVVAIVERVGGPPAPAPSQPDPTASLAPEDRLWLGLTRLRVVYEPWPVLNHPTYGGELRPGWRSELALRRLKSAWAWAEPGLKGDLSNWTPVVPNEVSAKIVSYITDADKLDHVLRPGQPIRTEGLTIAVLAPEFKVDLEVEDSPPIKGLVRGQLFKIPGAASQYRIDDIMSGTCETLDGKRTPLTPTVRVLPVPAGPTAGAAALITLPQNEARQVGGKKVRVVTVTDGCLLRYQHDPGELLWKVASILILLALCVRVYWSHYRVKLVPDDGGEGHTNLHFSVESHGVFSDPHRVVHRVEKTLQGLAGK